MYNENKKVVVVFGDEEFRREFYRASESHMHMLMGHVLIPPKYNREEIPSQVDVAIVQVNATSMHEDLFFVWERFSGNGTTVLLFADFQIGEHEIIRHLGERICIFNNCTAMARHLAEIAVSHVQTA